MFTKRQLTRSCSFVYVSPAFDPPTGDIQCFPWVTLITSLSTALRMRENFIPIVFTLHSSTLATLDNTTSKTPMHVPFIQIIYNIHLASPATGPYKP